MTMKKHLKLKKSALLQLILCVMLTSLSGLCYLFLALLSRSLPDQRAALAWDASGGSRQVSAFISQDEQMIPDQLIAQRKSVDNALSEAGLTPPSENARLWVDAYSTRGKLTLTTPRTAQEMQVIGVGGDFFLFHPYKLVSGAYFGASDLMRNRIVLDETAAWQLFGATQVESMSLTIDGIDYTVAGVIQNETDDAVVGALNGSPIVIVPFEALGDAAITCYEAILPEAVKGLALTTFQNSLTAAPENMQLRENSTRYTLWKLLEALPNFAARGVQVKPLIYPYWENAALTVENYAMLAAAGVVLFAIYPIAALIVWLCIRWKKRTWHVRRIRDWIVSRIDARNDRAYYRKKKAEDAQAAAQSESEKEM